MGSYLVYIGLAALFVYIFCRWWEKRHSAEARAHAWKTMELAKTISEICQSEVTMAPREKVHIFMRMEENTFRWSMNAFLLPGEEEVCTIEAAGIASLRRYKANTDMLLGTASDILRAYAEKRRREAEK